MRHAEALTARSPRRVVASRPSGSRRPTAHAPKSPHRGCPAGTARCLHRGGARGHRRARHREPEPARRGAAPGRVAPGTVQALPEPRPPAGRGDAALLPGFCRAPGCARAPRRPGRGPGRAGPPVPGLCPRTSAGVPADVRHALAAVGRAPGAGARCRACLRCAAPGAAAHARQLGGAARAGRARRAVHLVDDARPGRGDERQLRRQARPEGQGARAGHAARDGAHRPRHGPRPRAERCRSAAAGMLWRQHGPPGRAGTKGKP